MAEQTHNFKEISKVPDAKDFIDIVLSKTQRKTPTVVRPGFKITRIREFYARKIKFTQANYHEKLTEILEQFPRLEELHPFYSDLINVLYSKDHYKLALGQINTARTIVDNIAKDYLHLIKFGDSLYRCKQLKRAALGRMSTAVKRLNASLGYLEEVRQHLSRLPGIDPETRTLLITGFPNVGKSSFVNKVSRANVEVQPYAFTTKSIFVGHTDYKYLRYQVIDTPGILDHPLEARNTIEMQAITALAHLHAIVLFFIDISETCGYSIKQQVSLYHNIKPLFMNKPMLVVANKIDLKKFDALDPEDRKLIQSVAADRNTQIIQMSNASEEGINTVKSTACEQLLEFRVQKKAANSKRVNDVINRLDVALPVPRDNKVRSTSIPESVKAAADSDRPKRVTEKELEQANGGAGVYVSDWRKQYVIPDEYKYDMVPEILDGKNIADFYDPDIEAHLDALEKEEAELEAQWAAQAQDMDEDSDLDEEQKALVAEIREKKALIKEESALRKGNNRPVVPRKYKAKSFAEVKDGLGQVGVDADKLLERSNASKRKRTPSVHAPSESERPASASRTRSRSRSKAPEDMAPKMDGLRNVKQKKLVDKIAKQSQRSRNLDARASESDRHVFDLKPKHLFSGKRTIGKTDRR